MLQQAIAGDDPVIYFEPKRRYHDKSRLDTESIPDPLHKARIARTGSDLTLAAYGPMVKVCQDVANAAAEEGKSLEVVDLRSLSPIDFDTVQSSVQKTGRLVVVHEAPVFFGAGAEIAARITERCFYHTGPGPAGRRFPLPVSALPSGGRVPSGTGPGARRR